MHAQIERLASGLSHEPNIAVARLNVAPRGNKLSEASQFVSGVLGVSEQKSNNTLACMHMQPFVHIMLEVSKSNNTLARMHMHNHSCISCLR